MKTIIQVNTEPSTKGTFASEYQYKQLCQKGLMEDSY